MNSRGRGIGELLLADRNLLLGILAAQMNFVSRDALIAGMDAWAQNPDRALGTVLVEQGALTLARHTLLERLVSEHIEAHGGDPARSLATVDCQGTVGDELKRRFMPEFDSAADRTFSVGTSEAVVTKS